MHQPRNICSSSLPNASTAMKARRSYMGGLVVVFLLVLLTLFTVYGCVKVQKQSSLSQTQGTHRATAEQVLQPHSTSDESNRVGTGVQPTSKEQLQEINQVSNRSIEEVKADWEERLMTIPGVMGVGIGLTQDRQGTCIKVYVNRQSSAQTDQIPQKIEGYPVEVEVRKTFRAL